MSKGEQPRALRQSLQKSFATAPPVGGTLLAEIYLLKLEAAVRAAKEAAVTLPAAKAS
jgi:hypothetical protein